MFKIHATVRSDKGKGASRRLRHADKFPAIVYGGSQVPLALELNHNDLFNMQAKPEFYTEVLAIVVGDKETKVKIQAIQRHPFKPKVLHMDFVRV